MTRGASGDGEVLLTCQRLLLALGTMNTTSNSRDVAWRADRLASEE